jgi:hypothetical protein
LIRSVQTPIFVCLAAYSIFLISPLAAQETVGSITGSVHDQSGAAIPDATVKAHRLDTNLQVTVQTQQNGSYLVPNLPIGMYELNFAKSGFQGETHTSILVQGNRTATVDSTLHVGATSNTVEVTSTPLMNQVDTTNGYVVDQLTIQQTPLGTGSFTQLAILSPGVNADFLGGSGSNAGLGNQSIFANGQRDTSNSFSLNGVGTNNLFNGKSSSQVPENRFVLNLGENFGPGGSIQTSTSVYAAIGQALPTPAPESVQEIQVNAAMYDASQGSNSGAHIGVITKSGTNDFHGELYEKFQNSDMNAAPFFYNASPAIPADQKVPFLNRNMFGATFGGPIIKNKLFFFAAYQGVRLADAADATQDASVPPHLTDDRSPAALAQVAQQDFGVTVPVSQISPVALKLLQTKLSNGAYLIPSASITDPATAAQLGYNVIIQGANATSTVDQGSANVDYVLSDKDRLAVKYYIQNDPTTNPFGASSASLGFPQQLQSSSQVASIDNTVILSPSLTWQQRAGFTRMVAYAHTGQELTPQQFGINLLGSTQFPGISIQTSNEDLGNSFSFGPSSSFANAGMYQNQWEYESSLNWVKGRHTIAIGALWDHTLMNILNRNTDTDSVAFRDFANFLEGQVRSGAATASFTGTANRYYRADTVGAFISDSYKIASNLTLTLGLRWDYDGPLTEKYGRLTSFDANSYQFDQATDTIANSGLVVASNNATFSTPGASKSLVNGRQWGFAPRIGLAYTPFSKLTVRTGFGIYYDRGEFFSELSPSAGSGFNGPFGVTLEPPFVSTIYAASGATFDAPFGTTPHPPPPTTLAAFQALLPNLNQLANGDYPAGNEFGPFLFGGYDPTNKLPYSENWTFDLQYQATNSLLVSLGYVGNHGVHQVVPVPFNQPQIATPQHPVNGEIYSYGYNANSYETAYSFTGGNTDLRVPYVGYSPNSVFYKAEGISWYNALQLQVRKRLSAGLQFTATYTYSHSLDDQSGLGLFYTGNDPLNLKSGYGSSDFDRTHVLLVNYSYALPVHVTGNKFLRAAANGWSVGGQTVAESGQPYSVYDYSGSIASLYFSSYDYITNPVLAINPGVTVAQAELQGTTGVNAGKPVLDPSAFGLRLLQPGQSGVPPCDASGACDTYESLYSGGGRNIFRGPFQVRFDATIGKEFQINERFRLRFSADAFNLFNHPSFDAPNSNVVFFNYYDNPPGLFNPPQGSLGIIQHTIGSPRFLQLNLHLTF